MYIGEGEFAQYELGEALGEGTDLQVFAGRHRSTGAEVVLKRPHPTLVSRNQHQDVEARIRNSATLRQDFEGELPHVPRLLGVSGMANHDSLFGDTLGHEYTVTVESRARGVPLVGSLVDGLRKRPTGLPMNLFCLHPLQTRVDRGEIPIILDILETVESFYRVGYLLMDLRPQNVFFSPKTGDVSIIDVGDFRVPSQATRRLPLLDINDVFLDLLRWYVPAGDPPLDFDSWTRYTEPPRSPRFEHAVDDTLRLFVSEETTDDRALAIDMLERIKTRGYTRISEFESDIRGFFDLRTRRLTSSPVLASQMGLWKQGIAMMHDDYWRKFLFSAQPDLATYETAPL